MVCKRSSRRFITGGMALALFLFGLFLLVLSQSVYVEEKVISADNGASVCIEESWKVKILDSAAIICILLSFVLNILWIKSKHTRHLKRRKDEE